jgi:hypothetical protein
VVHYLLFFDPTKHIELGLSVLAYRGWFCELGKRDIYSNTKIGMYALRKGITITGVDTDSLLNTHPMLARDMCELLINLIAEGKLPTIAIEEYHYKQEGEGTETKT